jgi:hypothetical protein
MTRYALIAGFARLAAEQSTTKLGTLACLNTAACLRNPSNSGTMWGELSL